MFRQCSKLRGRRLRATDGEIGKLHDFYFDDTHWTVRYVVADTGYWLPDRLVLLSPHAIRNVDQDSAVVVDLTRKQIEDSPPITADQPVSRQYERDYYRYYGWPVYWTGPALWGPGPYPLYYAPVHGEAEPGPSAPLERGDPHLRSVLEIAGYRIHARDGDIGHLEDFVLDDRTWAIRYLVIDTRNWLPGKRVLVAPPWIENVSWAQAKVYVDLSRDAIQTAPAYDQEAEITRAYEIRLFQHYSRQGYWEKEQAA
jgi:hypothetical protein